MDPPRCTQKPYNGHKNHESTLIQSKIILFIGQNEMKLIGLHSGVKGSGANHYPRAPTQVKLRSSWKMTHLSAILKTLDDQNLFY